MKKLLLILLLSFLFISCDNRVKVMTEDGTVYIIGNEKEIEVKPGNYYVMKTLISNNYGTYRSLDGYYVANNLPKNYLDSNFSCIYQKVKVINR